MKEEQNLNKLPKDWKWVKLEHIAKWGSGGTPTSTNSKYYDGDIPWLIIGDLNDGNIYKSEKKITELGLENSSAKMVQPESVLIAMYGSIGKLGINKIPVATNQAIAFTEKLNDNIYNKFLFHYLYHIRSALHGLGKGGTQKNISQTVLKQVDFPCPPKTEQQAIAAKIEELFSEIDKGIEEIKTAQQQLKVYRQAVLKWAFEGRLTNDEVKESELPKRWTVKPLGILMESIRNGYSKKPDDTGDYKILRISSVRPNNVNVNEVRSLLNDAGDDNSVSENDLLFTRYNGSIDFVGVCGRVPKLTSKLFYPDKLIRCRPLIKESCHSAYLEYASNYGSARKFVLSRIKTTAGQTGISGSDLKQIPIPIAPLEEQRQIVQEIESRLSVSDKIEKTITNSLKQAEALRQSILRKAFEGKLV